MARLYDCISFINHELLLLFRGGIYYFKMSEGKSFWDDLSSRVIFFDSSSDDTRNKEALGQMRKKLSKAGFSIQQGAHTDLILESPKESGVTVVIANIINEHDIAGIPAIIQQYAPRHFICIAKDDSFIDQLPIPQRIPNNILFFKASELQSKFDDILRAISRSTTIKQGFILAYDPFGAISSELRGPDYESISIFSARTPEEFATLLRFHDGKLNGIVIDADDHAPELLSSAPDLGKLVVLLSREQFESDPAFKKAQYTIIKDAKGGFDKALFDMAVDHIVPLRTHEARIQVAPLQKKTLVGRFVYVVGPSAAGKTTLCKNIKMLRPDSTQFIAKYSTRPLRDGEEQGTDIIPVSDADFKVMLQQGLFCHAYKYRGFLYGIHKSTLDYLAANQTVLTTATNFDQIGDIAGHLNVFLKDNPVLPILIFSKRDTLEKRIQTSAKTEEEAAKRRAFLEEEEVSVQANLDKFKYSFFSGDEQNALSNVHRCIAALNWENAHPGEKYNTTHSNYVNTLLQIMLNRTLEDIRDDAMMRIDRADVDDFCSDVFRKELKDTFEKIFPLNIRCCVSNHGRIAVFIDEKTRHGPAIRNLVTDLFSYSLKKRGFVPKAVASYPGTYRQRSLFGLAKAEKGELCDGLCYSLTDEYSLHPTNHTPVMVSFGFFKGCSSEGRIVPLTTEETFELAKDLPEKETINIEFKHAAEIYQQGRSGHN